MAVGSSSIVERIAGAFDLAATLQLRRLARGTSLTSRTLLRLLHKGGPERLSLLAATGVSKPVITHLVGRMEREGLVIRSVDPADGRVTLAEITDAGRALHKEQRQSQRTRMAEVLDALSPEDELALGLAMSERCRCLSGSAGRDLPTADVADREGAIRLTVGNVSVALVVRFRRS